MAMATGEAQEAEMEVYLNKFKELDEKREGLDFEIHDILEEMDT